MHTLTTSDIAFLLCTTLSTTAPPKPPGTPGIPPFRLTLTTAYGLRIDITPTAPSDLSISLVKPNEPLTLSPSHTPSRHQHQTHLLPTPPPSPTSQARGQGQGQAQGQSFLFSPSSTGHTTSSTFKFLFNQTHGPTNWNPLDPANVTTKHFTRWFSCYADWLDRSQELAVVSSSFYSSQPGFEPSRQEQETREGEEILWVVEGVLLAAWLAMQEGVRGVEYRPWTSRTENRGQGEGEGEEKKGKGREKGYWLDSSLGVGVSEGVKRVLRDVSGV
ncbi:hypothetical protein QBC43DRAFT_372757 [Cladorrhinum sp. PSN259]|nr:hypothetical protein QBC43DRAFT_372757 [Cladorrhinum sp. PSN259]